MSHPLETLTPRQMMDIWGLRVSGASLKDPLGRSHGEDSGLDDELCLCQWIETVQGFLNARPVLVHLYVNSGNFSSYRYREPGETRMRAAMRHGQAYALLDGQTDAQMAEHLHDEFMGYLLKKQRQHPFKVPRRYEDDPPMPQERAS